MLLKLLRPQNCCTSHDTYTDGCSGKPQRLPCLERNDDITMIKILHIPKNFLFYCCFFFIVNTTCKMHILHITGIFTGAGAAYTLQVPQAPWIYNKKQVIARGGKNEKEIICNLNGNGYGSVHDSSSLKLRQQ